MATVPRDANKILLVEDELLLVMHMEQVLTDAGFRIVGEARAGEEAIDLAGRTAPDLVMMDVNLSGEMDGLDAAAAIWNRFGIPSLFLTGNADVARSPRAAEAHPVAVLEKPVDEGTVVRTLTEVLADGPPLPAGTAGNSERRTRLI